ncbi:hypothetical protein [Altererythrobacter sp. GH1-8]|uniref:hypothetical protein n=1 Tax=Altererythrobacter sp. GH1-8 TaxID=3349333 RepID=UPI00374CE8D4
MKVFSDSTRLGGLFLLLGAASMPFIIVEYVMVTSAAPPTGNRTENLAYFEANLPTLVRGWHFEVIAMALVGAGALSRLVGTARAGWALTAIGVASVLAMYPLMIGGYAAAFEADSLAGDKIVNAVATELFYAGNFLASAGLGLALFLEAKASERAAPGWVLWIGVIANSLAALGFLALHAGFPVSLQMVGPFGLVGFVSTAAFGAFVALKKT